MRGSARYHVLKPTVTPGAADEETPIEAWLLAPLSAAVSEAAWINGQRQGSQPYSRLEEGLLNLRSFALGENDAKPGDQLKALDLAAKYGLTAEKGYDRELVSELWDALAAMFDPETMEAVKAAWLPILARRIV